MSSPNIPSDPMDWQSDQSRSTPRQNTNPVPLSNISYRTTVDDFHPTVERTLHRNFPAPTRQNLGTPLNRVPEFDPNNPRSVNYTIFDEGSRRASPLGPRATRIPGPIDRTRLANPQRGPTPVRSMHSAESLQAPERDTSTLLELARRCIEEHRQHRYLGGNPQPRRVNSWRYCLPQSLASLSRPLAHRITTQLSSFPSGTLPSGPLFRDYRPSPIPAPTGGPFFNPATHSASVDSKGKGRAIHHLPARVNGRRSSRVTLQSGPAVDFSSAPTPTPTSPKSASFSMPPPVRQKRVLEEYQEEELQPEARQNISFEARRQALAQENFNKVQQEVMNFEKEDVSEDEDVEMEMFIPGAWPASPGPRPANRPNGPQPMNPLENLFEKLRRAVMGFTNRLRNAHTLVMHIGTETGVFGEGQQHPVGRIVRGAVEMAGTVKRRAIQLCSSHAPGPSEQAPPVSPARASRASTRVPASPNRIDLSKDRKNLRVLTPEERHRQKARRLGIGRGSYSSPDRSPYSISPTIPAASQSIKEEPSPTSSPGSTTHYPGSGRDIKQRQNKTNRLSKGKRSTSTPDKRGKASKVQKQKRKRSRKPTQSIQKLRLCEDFINSTAIITPNPVQYDISTPPRASTSASPSSAVSDEFDPHLQQYSSPLPVLDLKIEQPQDQYTEENLFSAPEQQLAAMNLAPERASSEESVRDHTAFTGTSRDIGEQEEQEKPAKKAGVRWADDSSPQRPISEVRYYHPDSRIDSPIHVQSRLVPGTRLRGASSHPPAAPRRVFVKALPPKWEKKVDEAMRLPNSHQLGTTPDGDPLTRRDLATCYQPLAWLNDEVINAYLAVIINFLRRGSEASSNEQPRHHAFNSFFFSNLRDKGYGSVRRWASRAKIGKENLLGVETVLVPIHHHSHWTLMVVRPAARTIEHFDSLGGMSRAHVALIKDWLRMELGDKYVEEEWTVLPSRSPQQDNGSDCGVFLLTTAKLRALNLDPLSYGAKDIPLIRKRIVGELMNGGFGGDLDPVEGRSRL